VVTNSHRHTSISRVIARIANRTNAFHDKGKNVLIAECGLLRLLDVSIRLNTFKLECFAINKQQYCVNYDDVSNRAFDAHIDVATMGP
jgi:hypothetical protein